RDGARLRPKPDAVARFPLGIRVMSDFFRTYVWSRGPLVAARFPPATVVGRTDETTGDVDADIPSIHGLVHRLRTGDGARLGARGAHLQQGVRPGHRRPRTRRPKRLRPAGLAR